MQCSQDPAKAFGSLECTDYNAKRFSAHKQLEASWISTGRIDAVYFWGLNYPTPLIIILIVPPPRSRGFFKSVLGRRESA